MPHAASRFCFEPSGSDGPNSGSALDRSEPEETARYVVCAGITSRAPAASITSMISLEICQSSPLTACAMEMLSTQVPANCTGANPRGRTQCGCKQLFPAMFSPAMLANPGAQFPPARSNLDFAAGTDTPSHFATSGKGSCWLS